MRCGPSKSFVHRLDSSVIAQFCLPKIISSISSHPSQAGRQAGRPQLDLEERVEENMEKTVGKKYKV